MTAQVMSAGLAGMAGFDVLVETSVTNGLPAFAIVGLPDSSVQESRERVRAVIKNIGLAFPARRILVNLAPADTRKEGPIYDLPIALGVLIVSGQLEPVPDSVTFIGELSLDGRLRPVTGTLPMALSAYNSGAKGIFVPKDSADEASLVDGLAVYPAGHITEILAHLRGEAEITPYIVHDVKPEDVIYPDFSEVQGQEAIRRSIEVAVSGSHNILLNGPAGSGKSMMAKRVPSILPPMTKAEMIEATAVHSVAGMTSKSNPLLRRRPFRSPHHTISASGLAGGGRVPKPGEMSLAHNGVLFLDEFPEFHRDALESLRQPMEDGRVTITRAGGAFTFPSGFMLVCAMNPCKCGWYGHPSGKCVCSEDAVRNYLKRISGPILDRIDIFIGVPSVKYAELTSKTENESSAEIRKRVVSARNRQTKRQGAPNARLSTAQIKTYCRIDKEGDRLMRMAYDKLGLSARAYDKILRVARTIADLADSDQIRHEHLAEAIQYRNSGMLEI
ncbi:MAG: YifB family Mg chelatase-like AAA ATPase [Clostridiales Family XIII bacterium]|jgi:magnesium chelatase family protein|nr:YifB family Mg chelatase-like AAA ATPase [Clostridiales Family XIII bacterium]